MVRVLGTLLLLLIGATSCKQAIKKDETSNNSDQKESLSLIAYFYPFSAMKAPITYLYRNSSNPMDERYAHLIPQHQMNDTAYIIERFNANLRLTEAFSLTAQEGFIVVQKHKVSTPETKYEAKLKSNQWFPLQTNSIAHFSSNYPENDSIIQVWDQKRSFDRFIDDFSYNGTSKRAAKIISDVVIYRIDQKNKKEQKAAELTLHEYWVEGVGLVKTHPADDETLHYMLDKQLSQENWAQLFNL